MSESDLQLETVNLRVENGAATVELNRPEALNAWNHQFGADLLEALRHAAGEDSIRAIVITGAGRGFSSGADLKDMSGAGSADPGAEVYRTLTERYHPIMHLIREVPKPVISSVNGPAVGIGASLALVSDIVIAARSAYFLFAFVNIGLVPDGGSSLYLPSRIGMARATELSMLGERLPAERALEWGLINRVVDDEQLAAATAELAGRLAAGPTRSYAGTKRQLNNWLYARMDEQLELEAQIQREMAGSADFIEGAMAFVQKRPAKFSGS